MKSLRIIILVACGITLLISCATSYVPRMNSRQALMDYVERAAALVARQGPESACSSFTEPKWMGGDYYVFISRVSDNVVVCHPVNATLVGVSQTDLRDVNGKYFVRDMADAANSAAGRGWVEYQWARPGQTTPEPKSAYVVAVTAPDGKRYIVGSGGYNMPSM
jgi:signal transduction histidine kinase